MLVGGEGPIGPRDLTKGLAYDIAVKHHGFLVELEHRFYGVSLPSTNVADYWLLSTEQAIEDFTAFVTKTSFPTGNSTIQGDKWLAFGGSYSGNVAAWLRLKYPNTFWAAHAASAPVWAKEDFPEYGESVDAAIPRVNGGNKACLEGLIIAAETLDAVVSSNDTAAIKQLKADFGLSNVTENSDFASFATTLFAYIAQYGPDANQLRGKRLVDAYCDGKSYPAITNPNATATEKLDALAALVKAYVEENPDSLQFVNTRFQSEISDMASWVWQVCTEYGYLQTKPAGRSSYSKFLTLDYFKWQCDTYYGQVINPDTNTPIPHSRPNTQATNTRYHSTEITQHVTNVLFSDGLIDPWSKLSVTSQASRPGIEIINHEGFHCDEYRSTPAVAEWKNTLLKVWDDWIVNILNRPTYYGTGRRVMRRARKYVRI